ncbi:Muskelin N-terminus-domain-containing protein [Trametes elegans]|nr:Muskelin N-terminus-domain-containing protein [Trametes elegans]
MSESGREPEVVSVEYEIVGSSEHSGDYVAQNILVDRPRDHSSRWSAAFAVPNTKSITFGKFFKVHPCNMKEFKILVGVTQENMTEVLRGSLRNDANAETFSIRSTNRAGMPFPTQYVEIVPLSAHGQNFNTSIWHVSFSGITDEAYVEQVRVKHQEYRENVALRQVVKHLRQRRFLTPVNHILSQAGLQFEHPLSTSIHESFVLRGDWSRTEQLIRDCADAGLLRSYRHSCQARTRWKRIRALDPDGDFPCGRGGHAMCMDEQNGVIYLFGGWDGHRNLDDLWAYDVATDSWRLLSLATSREKNGPSPRACHKMVFDSKTGSIYLLGRLGDGTTMETRSELEGVALSSAPDAPVLRHVPLEWSHAEPMRDRRGTEYMPSTALSRRLAAIASSHCSEFFRYHTRGLDTGKWDLLSFDTATSGGPPLISDHQMEIDCERQMIYVFGGRVSDAEWEILKLSGMYSYDIPTSKWKLYNTSDAYASHPSISPRFGHSMVLDAKAQTLFIFGGQRDESYLSDMYAFHIPTNTVTELFANVSSSGGPDPFFTQRAVLDPETQEIYVFGGLTRAKAHALPVLEAEAPYWIYRYERPELPGKWSKILPESGPDAAAWPQPRYAHQVVYDARTKTAYMHGGNGGLEADEPAGSDGDRSRPDSAGSGSGVSESASRSRSGRRLERDLPSRRTSSDADMKRLEDFWRFEIIRPSYEEIIRRALFEIRKQQFREMCEDGPSIKALTFLQTRVSEVVNHEDAEEAKTFRTLLSAHLLSASPHPTPEPVASSSTVHDDSPPPRKRSRSGSPVQPTIRLEKDPLEGEGAGAPSPERFRQRTEMFERLMAFINEDAKQPDQDLLDIMSNEGLVI